MTTRTPPPRSTSRPPVTSPPSAFKSPTLEEVFSPAIPPSTIDSPRHKSTAINPSSSRENTVSSSQYQAEDEREDEEGTEADSTDGMDYEPSPSSIHQVDRLNIPNPRAFVRSIGAPSPTPFPMPGSSLIVTSSVAGDEDDGGDTPRAVRADSEGIDSDVAIDGVKDMIRLKKSQIRKLQEEVEWLEKTCGLAETGKNHEL
ncbi:hypothetical protein TWF281_003849 [Arthrobotrys megalospora]